MKSIRIVMIAAIVGILAGCASPKIDYTEYQHKLMLCKQMDMEIFTVQAYDSRNGVIYTKDVVCKDQYGGTWSSDRM